MIPPAVDVFGKRYRIDQKEVEQTSDGDYGECFVDQCRIEVATYQCSDQMRDTLLHEVTHAIDHELHCNLSEAQVRRMSTGWLAVLRQNPDLAAFLVGTE